MQDDKGGVAQPPLKTSFSSAAPVGPPPADTRRSRSRASILLVDDQPARLLTYEAILSGLDVQCVRAVSGAEALERLLTHQFAVILLDVHMPGMDGFELARLIREHPRLEQTPIIFITGVHVSELDQLRGYAEGAIDYISVPVVPEILRSKVAMLVELHYRRSELQALNRELRETRAQLEARHAQKLAEREAQLSAVFEHPDQLTLIIQAQRDNSGRIRDWIYTNVNTNAAQLLGFTRETIVGRRLSEALGERTGHAIGLCTQVLTTGESARYETTFAGRDFLVTIYPFGNDCVISSAVDITTRKIAEAAVRESERRNRALLEEAPVGIAHSSLNGAFQYINQAFCRLVGYSADELRAMTWQQITHPDDVAQDQSHYERALSSENSHYTLEKRYVRKDGSFVWVSLFVNFVADDAGRPVQAVAIAADISERKRADDALRESERRFRELANNIDQFAWACDEHGTASWYNDRWYEYSGTTFEQMRADGWNAVLDPAHMERVVASFSRAVRTGEPWEDTYPLRGKDGQYRWFLSRAVPIRDSAGRVVRWFGTNTDVTELRRLQDALSMADRRKDEFLAMLAHELRNPVAPISNAAEVLARVLPQHGKLRPLASMIQRQCTHLSRILDDLLDVARVTQGRIELRRQTVSIASCIDLAIATVQPLVGAKGHHVTVTRTAEPLHVSADKVRLEQCIANVLANAVKYTDVGGEIRISAYAENGAVVVDVTDTGIGIAADFIPCVFDLFAQSATSLDRSQGGLGIGLAICKQLIEMHGGTVACSSAGLGRGSTFTIRLPRIEDPGEARVNSNGLAQVTRSVLIVDDNRDAADSLAMCLQLEGHEVSCVYSGEDAMRQVAAFAPDVVLLDIGLPGMDGYETARRIRVTSGSTRLVALTGYGQAEDKHRSAAAGFDAYLVKPVDMQMLKKTLASL